MAFIALLLLATSLDTLFEQAARYDWGANPAAIRELEQHAYKATPAEAADLEKRYLALLRSPASTLAAKDEACRGLSIVGTKSSLPTLREAQKNSKLQAIATFAINRIQPPPAAKPEAKDYRKLFKDPSTPEPERVAALIALPRSEAVAALKDPSPAVRAAAIRHIGNPKVLIDNWEIAPAQVLAALADKGERTALPLFVKAADHPDELVRTVALNALGKLGDASHIDLLARKSPANLARIPGVDKPLVDALSNAEGQTRIAIIRALGDRGARGATPALLNELNNPKTRRAAITALRETAGPQDAGALVGALVASQDEDDQAEYARAIAAAIRRSKDVSMKPVLAAWHPTQAPEAKVALLRVMSQVGSPEALPTVRQAINDKDPDLQRAAINALADWPTPEPLDDLIAIARNSPNAAHQVLSLRGYLKLAQLPAERTPDATVKVIAAALETAKRPDEKRLALSALQRVFHPDALKLAQQAEKDPAIAKEAAIAIKNLERGLSFRR